jgi:hypothetical protein
LWEARSTPTLSYGRKIAFILPAYGNNNSNININAKLPGKAEGQGCRERLPCKAAIQVCRAFLIKIRNGCSQKKYGKSAGQGCVAMVNAKVQFAESMVKFDNKAVM